jgi:hypothetical protein
VRVVVALWQFESDHADEHWSSAYVRDPH